MHGYVILGRWSAVLYDAILIDRSLIESRINVFKQNNSKYFNGIIFKWRYWLTITVVPLQTTYIRIPKSVQLYHGTFTMYHGTLWMNHDTLKYTIVHILMSLCVPLLFTKSCIQSWIIIWSDSPVNSAVCSGLKSHYSKIGCHNLYRFGLSINHIFF